MNTFNHSTYTCLANVQICKFHARPVTVTPLKHNSREGIQTVKPASLPKHSSFFPPASSSLHGAMKLSVSVKGRARKDGTLNLSGG